MTGLAVLILLAAYPLISLVIVVRAWRRSWRGGAVAMVIAATLPIADAVVGRQAFDHYCAYEGKTVIVETIKDVEGIGVEYGVFNDSPSYYGYQFVEGGYAYDFRQTPWMYERAERSSSGNMALSKNIQPRAKYLLREGPLQQSYYFNRSRISIIEIQTGRELAGFGRVGFRGGWAEQVVFAFASSGPQNRLNCPDGHTQLKEKTMQMLHATLI
jgi:hypothetical protein